MKTVSESVQTFVDLELLIRHKFKNNKKDYSRQKQEPPFYLDNEILFKSQGIRYLHITYVTRSH